jgi:hypothetical protein
MSDATTQAASQPSEQELQAAYEAELNRITSAELVLQTAVSLLNLGARRLGLMGAEAQPDSPRDLEQVRDAIDAVRGLMPILERRHLGEAAQLRGALSQLQMAYAREVPRSAVAPQGGEAAAPDAAPDAAPAVAPEDTPATVPPGASQTPPAQAPPPSRGQQPGPAESSGRLWVPGR